MTLTTAVPDPPPDFAVIVAVPLPTAVTRPDASTVATGAALLDHPTSTPAITFPYWSVTSAPSWTVAPNAVSSAVDGVTATDGGGCSSQADAQGKTISTTAGRRAMFP